MPQVIAARSRVAASLLLAALLTAPFAHADPPSKVDACVSAAEAAQHQRKAAHLRDARASLVACAQSECPRVVRDDCSRWLAEVDEALPTVVMRARDSLGHDLTAVRVSLDGAPLVERLDGKAVAIDPGEHTLRFESPDHVGVEQRIVVVEGQHERLVDVVFPAAGAIAVPPASAPPPERTTHRPVASYVVGGFGVLSLGAFATFDALAWSSLHRLQGTCGTQCAPDQTDAGRRDVVVAATALGVGVVALGVAAWMFFHPRQEP
ncbi:MAG TPA: hypothetical protein VIY73_28155 [Polyangiaceae bacterium]